MTSSYGAAIGAGLHFIIALFSSGAGAVLLAVFAVLVLTSLLTRGSEQRIKEAEKQAELEMICR